MIKDIDYYIDENKQVVLTEYFLKKRGRCCKKDCKHCPYGFQKEKSSDNTGNIEPSS
jgi:biotin synthase-like enzyme